MRDLRLCLFTGDDPVYRFCGTDLRGRQAVPIEALEGVLRSTGTGSRPLLTIAGSDPLEHPEFPRLLRLARELGFDRLALLTDGWGLARPAAVELLRGHAFEALLVVFPSAERAEYGRLMGGSRRFEPCRRGVEAAVAGGLATSVVVPLARAGVRAWDAFLGWLARTGVRGVLGCVPRVERVPPATRGSLLRYREASRELGAVFNLARQNRLAIGVHERQGIPPCADDGTLAPFGDVFNQRARHQRAHPEEACVRVAACAACDLRVACRGVDEPYVEAFGQAEFEPVPLRVANAWNTKPLGLAAAAEYRRVSPFVSSGATRRSVLRVNGNCNMGCSFCFADLSLPNVPEADLLAEIARLARGGTTHLVLSGGEPSLHPSLPVLISAARTLGIAEVELQTNGVMFASVGAVERVVGSGLTISCVSLHSHRAERSDELTKLPGAFERTLAGIRNFRASGVWTRVAHVINRMNYREMPEFAGFLRREFPDGKLDICFSLAQEISSQASTWMLPSFTEIRPFVREALDFCRSHDIAFSGLIGQGGYPPCMLDGELGYYRDVLDQVHRDERAGTDFLKAERCGRCSFDAECLGVRRSYVETYGEEEIRPF